MIMASDSRNPLRVTQRFLQYVRALLPLSVALLFVGILSLPLTAAQSPFNRWQGNPMLLRGPGSQIGVMLRDVQPQESTTAPGVVVATVNPKSPAAQGDMRAGDIVTIFDGENVRRVRDLQRLISETPPGKSVRVTVVRDGRTLVLAVTPTS